MEKGEIQYDSRQKYIDQLAHIKNNLDYYNAKEDYPNQYLWLKNYFSALSHVMGPEEKQLHREIHKHVRKINRTSKNMIKKGKTLMDSFFDDYFEWELLLKEVEGNLGLTVPRARNAGTAISGGTF